jgi:hypothetical protein
MDYFKSLSTSARVAAALAGALIFFFAYLWPRLIPLLARYCSAKGWIHLDDPDEVPGWFEAAMYITPVVLAAIVAVTFLAASMRSSANSFESFLQAEAAARGLLFEPGYQQPTLSFTGVTDRDFVPNGRIINGSIGSIYCQQTNYTELRPLVRREQDDARHFALEPVSQLNMVVVLNIAKRLPPAFVAHAPLKQSPFAVVREQDHHFYSCASELDAQRLMSVVQRWAPQQAALLAVEAPLSSLSGTAGPPPSWDLELSVNSAGAGSTLKLYLPITLFADPEQGHARLSQALDGLNALETLF